MIHHLTHKHATARKNDVGELAMCFWRWPSGRLVKAWFKPAFPDAHWHEVAFADSATQSVSDAVIEVMKQESSYEAMRMLRGLSGRA